MKKIIFVSALLFVLMTSVQAQHTLYLKTGETLKGQLVGGTEDTVYFDFFGNRLALPHSSLSAVYFDLAAAPKEIADPDADKDASIRGYVIDNYVMQENERYDAGANIWIVPVSEAKNVNIRLFTDTLSSVIAIRDILNQFAENGTAVPENVVVEMRRLNCETETQFQQYCRRANLSVASVKNAKGAIRATSNAEGQYSVRVKSGSYYVLAVSKQAKADNPVEIGGMVNLQQVSVQPQEELVVTSKFEIFT